MRTMWMIVGAIAGSALMPPTGIGQTAPSSPRPATAPAGQQKSTSGADADFVRRAAEGGMKEVEAGKIASQKAANAEVKAFAQRMVQDHTKSNDELMNLARDTAPAAAKADQHKAAMTKLSGQSGAAFDRAYMAEMVTDHEMTVALFEKEAKDGQNEALRSWAGQKLPALREHLQMARNVHGKLAGSSK